MMNKCTTVVACFLSFFLFTAIFGRGIRSLTDLQHPVGGEPGAIDTSKVNLQENNPLYQSPESSRDTVDWPSESLFLTPPASAKPWVFWYWMQAGVSRQGITADLEAMKQTGIGGAYLMSIQDTADPSLYKPAVRQLTPEWWSMVKFAMEEAKRLDLKLAMHVSDGFSLAGGPWISPELSMQKLVWTKEYVKGGGDDQDITIPQPEVKESYYKDIAVLAYPANCSQSFSDTVLIPRVTSSTGAKAQFLAFDNDNRETFKSDTSCWIQYKYPQPFTCRSITIHTNGNGNNYQSQRLIVQVSNNGEDFTTLTRLEPPRHGWQDTDEDITHSIPAVSALYFRFVYDKAGSEPGAEDIAAAKWNPALNVAGIYLSDEPAIHQYQGKNGSVWLVSKKSSQAQLPDSVCVPLNAIIDLSDKMDEAGNLNWKAPAGHWIIVRIGHTSTGHTNTAGGSGKGLECDKFNPAAVKLQFDKWFGEAVRVAGPDLAKQVIDIFHVNSWGCGSQNWSTVLPAEFKKRKGYDLGPYLLTMTGTPVQNTATSEAFLHDMRETIASLVADNFYGTLRNLAHDKGVQFSAESVAPSMTGDGMLHYRYADLPMGEFWLNSPTHDKPNNMLDAISGAHIYGKPIIQAESFTSLRMTWGEHPGMLKAVGDRNFALGANRLVLHIFTHNPWMDRKPGMPLDGMGLYYQRDQTWYKQSKAWIDYLARCQALLQLGRPVADIAVFTGEEVPRRSVLPDRLVPTLPGIMGSANMAYPEKWIDPLNGYAYDAINPDALLRLATVKNKRIILPGGASYGVLVLPKANPLTPDKGYLSADLSIKIANLIKGGAVIIMADTPVTTPSLDDLLDHKMQASFDPSGKTGKGKIISGSYTENSFSKLGIEKDFIAIDKEGNPVKDMAWTHRQGKDFDIYFISNQQDAGRQINISVRVKDKMPELWDPASEKGIRKVLPFQHKQGRTMVPVYFYGHQSLFLVFRKKLDNSHIVKGEARPWINDTLTGKWLVQFDTAMGGPQEPVLFDHLQSWTEHPDTTLRYYSGTAIYSKPFSWGGSDTSRTWLYLEGVNNIATVKVNGIDCGTVWTAPYRVYIGPALQKGLNKLEIEITNTWANRLIGDQRLPEAQRQTWINTPYRLQDTSLLPAGLTGNVIIVH